MTASLDSKIGAFNRCIKNAVAFLAGQWPGSLSDSKKKRQIAQMRCLRHSATAYIQILVLPGLNATYHTTSTYPSILISKDFQVLVAEGLSVRALTVQYSHDTIYKQPHTCTVQSIVSTKSHITGVVLS